MPPLPPRVLGPISVCSARVRVQGQVTGATVTILADGQVVGKAPASGPDQWIDLDTGVTLQAHAKVAAVQEAGGETSAASPEPVLVQSSPHHPGRVVFMTHPWVGGECILLAGAVPGATVTISGTGGSYHGQADDGTVTIHRKPLIEREVMHAHQVACGAPGAAGTATPAEEWPTGFTTPRFVDPLAACQTSLTVTGAADGGTVTITRGDGSTLTACFPVADGIINLDRPLDEHEQLSLEAQLPSGGMSTGQSRDMVGPRPPAPVIAGHLCAGATMVRIKGAVRGTRVDILQDGQSIGYCEAPATDFTTPVPALQAGTKLQLGYVLCGDALTTDQSWPVDTAPASVHAPEIAGSPVECGLSVHVQHVSPGAQVLVYSEQLGAPIGEAFAEGSSVDVIVAPLLMHGDRISAVQIACGRTSRPSPAVAVHALGTLHAPQIQEPLYEGRQDVTVVSVQPGAQIDVYVQGLYAGSAVAQGTTQLVPVQMGGFVLIPGQKVEAIERLCAQTVRSPSAVVQAIPPVIHFSAVPDTIDAGQTATLVWRIDNAQSATLQGVGSVPVDGSRQVRPSSTTQYTLTAQHENATATKSVTVTVHTIAPPPPPVGFSSVAIYNCNEDLHAVHIWVQDVTAGEALHDVHTLENQVTADGCGPFSGAVPYIVPLRDGHVYNIYAVDPDHDGCGGANDPTNLSCEVGHSLGVRGSTTGQQAQMLVGGGGAPT